MKKFLKVLFPLFLMIFLIVPTISTSESSYTSKLGMTMEDFILKYNAVPTALNSPYKSLSKPIQWSTFNGYNVAWFYPESSSTIALLLLSKDTNNIKNTKAGLDAIQIFSLSKESWIPLLCITKRCASIYGEDIFGISTSSFSIIETINYYYENDLENKGYISYRSLNADETLALTFGYSDGYYFSITATEDAI